MAADDRPLSHTTRLTLEGLRPGSGNPLGVRIYINTPGADRRTGIDVPGYVGSVAFGHGPGESSNYLVNPGRAIERLAKGGTPVGSRVRVTIVPIQVEPLKHEQPITVDFGSVSLEVVRP